MTMSEKSSARRASLSVKINNVDVTSDLQQRFINCTFTDSLDGEADDFTMTVQDRDGKVIGDWLGKEIDRRAKANKGGASKATILPTIYQKNWNGDGKDISLRCGSFTLDDVRAGGPPMQVTMQGSSADYCKSLRKTKKTKAWKNTTLRKIGLSIAKTNGYALLYLSNDEISYKRINQQKQTDAAFLQKRCTKAGLSMKITNSTIVIFDAKTYEKKTEVRTFTMGKGGYEDIDFQAKLSDTCYEACVVTYEDPVTGKTYTGSYPKGYTSNSTTSTSGSTTTYTGKEVDALFTAYYPANNRTEGGYYAKNGEKLKPGSKTCAAPRSIAFNKKIQISGTGTSRDGEVYRVNDRGGAIKIVNGRYHFDILMSSAKQCNQWGKRYGKALIISKAVSSTSKKSNTTTTASSSSGKKDIIDVAISQLGGYGSDKNKFSRFTNTYGAFWCHSFVSWCANQAGVPTSIFPKTASTDTGMAWFKKRGRFKYKGKYTPKRGDVIYFKTGASHVGLVEYVSGSTIHTIEGNTTGDYVRRRKYSPGSRGYRTITGYGVPNYSYLNDGRSSGSSSSSSETEANILKVTNEKVSSNTEAAALAKARLREANKGEITGSMSMALDLTLCAGLTIKLKSFGGFSGKYIIEQTKHTLSRSGSKTSISFRRVITEY